MINFWILFFNLSETQNGTLGTRILFLYKISFAFWFWHVVIKIIWIPLFHWWNNIESLKWWDHALVKIFHFRYLGRLERVLFIMLIEVFTKNADLCQTLVCLYDFSSGYRSLLLLLRYLIDFSIWYKRQD